MGTSSRGQNKIRTSVQLSKKDKNGKQIKINKNIDVKTKGASGRTNNFIGVYETLKVIPKSKRTKENCNSHGVANIK